MQSESKFTIRRATAADAASLVELASRVYYETFAAVNTPENMAAYLSTAFTLPQMQTELSDARAVFFVAEASGKFAGYAKLMPSPAPECVTGEAPVELVRFYVAHQWHGTGLASLLMERCLTDARQLGFTTMFLGVWEHNYRAQAFYRKWNFVRIGDHIFQMGDDPQIDWWMMRTI